MARKKRPTCKCRFFNTDTSTPVTQKLLRETMPPKEFTRIKRRLCKDVDQAGWTVRTFDEHGVTAICEE